MGPRRPPLDFLGDGASSPNWGETGTAPERRGPFKPGGVIPCLTPPGLGIAFISVAQALLMWGLSNTCCPHFTSDEESERAVPVLGAACGAGLGTLAGGLPLVTLDPGLGVTSGAVNA
jgi:hypothetical protein